MKKFNSNEFRKAFEELGFEKGDTVLVHNSLMNFGIPQDIPLQELPRKIYEDLVAVLGKEGTIVVPAFNFDFCKGTAFNRQETPSKSMGVFSEFVRKLPESRRTTHPMQSVAVVGKARDFLVEEDTFSAFSDNSAFDKLTQLNTKILLLGADFNSISMIHWVEERKNVPYRYWESFSAEYMDSEKGEKRTYKMFVRDLETNPILKLYDIEKRLDREEKVKKKKVGGGQVKCLQLQDFLSVARECLDSNPYYFVSNHSKFLMA